MAVIHVTKENFQKEVLEAKVPVLVDFWATWCGPCQMLGPVVEELANEVTDAKICKIDIDAEEDIALEYRIMSVPTLIVFKDGKKAASSVGVISKSEMKELIASVQ